MGEGAGWEGKQPPRAFRFSPNPPSGKTLPAAECKEGPGICRQRRAPNPGCPPFTAEMTLEKLLTFSEPQLPHLSTETNHSPLTGYTGVTLATYT